MLTNVKESSRRRESAFLIARLRALREMFVCPGDLEEDRASRRVARLISESARLLCTHSPSLRIKHAPFLLEGPTTGRV